MRTFVYNLFSSFYVLICRTKTLVIKTNYMNISQQTINIIFDATEEDFISLFVLT